MIPGWHFDWNKQKLYNVSLPEADKFFYTQLLTGDAVDNIEGCPQIGAKKAEQILSGAGTPLEMYRRCQETYVQHHRKVAEKFGLSCAENERAIFEAAMRDLEENAHLLWIQREEGVRWISPAD
jgi:5'-3' exonuclease